MPMSHSELNRAMNSLRPGDVLTNLNCEGCAGRKILVLARVGANRYDFSVRANEINIVRDRQGPWRWVENERLFRNNDDVAHDHIGAEVELLEAAGTRELQWYRELPQPALARFAIDPKNPVGAFEERKLSMMIDALINRSADSSELARNSQLAVDLIFGSASEGVDERRMRHLVALAHMIGKLNNPFHGMGISVMSVDGLGGLSELLRGLGVPGDIGGLERGMRGSRRQERRPA